MAITENTSPRKHTEGHGNISTQGIFFFRVFPCASVANGFLHYEHTTEVSGDTAHA
jgi:hypothetical protein